MSPAMAAERARELDHEHRKRLRPALPMLLSMRYLTRALGRRLRGTQPVQAASVPRPAPGTMSITFVGHATVMLTTATARLLVDPLLENSLLGVRRAKAAALAPDDLDDVDLVLVTHAHRDHLSKKSLARLSRVGQLVLPPGCGSLVRGLGFAEVVELDPGARFKRGEVEVTAVPVRHSGTRGLGDYARRGAGGYVVRAADVTAYVAGDTGYFSGFAEIGRRFRPDVALLPIGGYEPAAFREEHLSPLDAIYAFEDLGARILVPTSYGSFPLSYEPLDAPLAWLRQLAQPRGLLGGAANPRAADARFLAVLDHGETIHVRGRAASAPASAA